MKARSVSAKRRREVLESGGCVYCGGFADEVDHITPVSRGGGNERENLAPACFLCNREKLDFTPEEWEAWRIETGRPWPPPNTIDIRLELVAALASRLDEEELEQFASRSPVTEGFFRMLWRSERLIYAGQSTADRSAAVLEAFVRDSSNRKYQELQPADEADSASTRSDLDHMLSPAKTDEETIFAG
jgi:hypothetical protein